MVAMSGLFVLLDVVATVFHHSSERRPASLGRRWRSATGAYSGMSMSSSWVAT